MVFNLDDLKAAKAENSKGYLLAPGTYPATIVEVEDKENSNKTGSYLRVNMQAKKEKTYLTSYINYDHENEKTQSIGLQDLVKLAEAVGVDLEKFAGKTAASLIPVLKGKSLAVRVDVETTEKWGDQNRVKGYKKEVAAATPKPASTGSFIASEDIPF